MKTESALELVPVVDLSSCLIEESAYLQPVQPNPDEWEVYWQQRMAEAGFGGLPWLVEGYSVPVAALTAPLLLEHYLAREVFASLENGYQADLIGPLSGGYVLRCGTEVLVTPSCCGDLTNLVEWKKAACYRDADWFAVWIGHPFISVRWREEQLAVSAKHEPGKPPEHETVRLNPAELRAAIQQAEDEVAAFRRQLKPILPRFVGDELTEEVVEILIAGHRYV